MPVLMAAVLTWSAALHVTYEPERKPSEGHVYVRGDKARVEVGETVAIWDGKALRVKFGAHKPVDLDPGERAAFGIPPSCLEACGFAQLPAEPIGGVSHKIYEKLFKKTAMGPLKQRVWIAPDGTVRRSITRSARGATRMELSSVRTAPQPSEKLFTFR